MNQRLHLSDLDELLLTVRDITSRVYMLEAVNAYRAGVYRAAVVSTWVAVVYDLIGKFRELAASGDPAANARVAKIDNWIQNNNKIEMQRFEQGLIAEAAKDYEFFSAHEIRKFENLREDRHLCAHPAFSSDEALFQPSAEQVRAHIVHAVESLLRHPPMQGKSALERIMIDLSSNSFPKDRVEAERFIEHSYVDRAREVLVRNLILTMLKVLVNRNVPNIHPERILVVLAVILRRHPEVFELTFRSKCGGILANTYEDNRVHLLQLIAENESIWDWLDLADRTRLVGDLAFANPQNRFVYEFVNHKELGNSVKKLVLDGGSDVLIAIQIFPSAKMIPVFCWRLEVVGSYREAETIMESAANIGTFMELTDVKTILGLSISNSQVYGSTGVAFSMTRFLTSTERFANQLSSLWWKLARLLNEYSGNKNKWLENALNGLKIVE